MDHAEAGVAYHSPASGDLYLSLRRATAVYGCRRLQVPDTHHKLQQSLSLIQAACKWTHCAGSSTVPLVVVVGA
jgi:hypothetical protein